MPEAPAPTSIGSPSGRRLDSWKEIAEHLGREVRTAQRWEREQGLPVYRHIHRKRSSVYAFSAELDAWWTARAPAIQNGPAIEPAAAPEQAPPVVRPRRLRVLLASVAVGMLCALAALVAFSRRPDTPFRQIEIRPVLAGGSMGPAAAVSPDGRWFVYVQIDGVQRSLWLRQIRS